MQLSSEQVLQAVVEAWQKLVDPSIQTIMLYSRSRRKEMVQPRLVAYWALHKYSGMSYAAIGRMFDRDHSTIRDGVTRVQNTFSAVLLLKIEMLVEDRFARTSSGPVEPLQLQLDLKFG